METAFIIALFQVKRTVEKDLKHLFITSSSSHFFNKTDFKRNHFKARGVASFARSGGAKSKSAGQRFPPKSEGFYWPKSQIFRPKTGDLQKKKVFAEIQRLFLAEITNFNVFSPKNINFFLPKKFRGRQEKNWGGGQKRKSGGHCPPCPPAGDAPGQGQFKQHTCIGQALSLPVCLLSHSIAVTRLRCVKVTSGKEVAKVAYAPSDQQASLDPQLLTFLPEVESSRTSLASRTSSRTHFEVLGLGLEASSPRKFPSPRLKDSTIFEPLKFRWKTPETLQKICKDLFFGFLK